MSCLPLRSIAVLVVLVLPVMAAAQGLLVHIQPDDHVPLPRPIIIVPPWPHPRPIPHPHPNRRPRAPTKSKSWQ